VSNLRAIVTDIVLRVIFGKLLEQLLGPHEVLLNEDLGVVVCALGSLLAVAVHVVPAEFADDVFELAAASVETEAHVEVGAALVDVAVGAVFPLLALLLHEVRTNLQVVAEVAFVSVATLA
jgi:hypothetical protein